MTYRVYTGPPNSKEISEEEKARWLYKEFGLLDEALGWARHVNEGYVSGRNTRFLATGRSEHAGAEVRPRLDLC